LQWVQTPGHGDPIAPLSLPSERAHHGPCSLSARALQWMVVWSCVVSLMSTVQRAGRLHRAPPLLIAGTGRHIDAMAIAIAFSA
jgi:hypothetical protein